MEIDADMAASARPKGDVVARHAALDPETLTKPTNPKDAVGIKKVPFSTIPAPVIAEVGLGMLEGALKYGRHNYRVIGVRASVYYDAVNRHISEWWEGEDIDPASGVHHLSKAIASLVVIRDAIMRDNFNDDRPPRSKSGWMEELNAKAGALIDKYPNPVPAYTDNNQPVRMLHPRFSTKEEQLRYQETKKSPA